MTFLSSKVCQTVNQDDRGTQSDDGDILSEDEREENIAGRNVAEVEVKDIQGDNRSVDDSNNSNGGKERVGSYSTEVEYELGSDVENSDAGSNPGEMEVDNLSPTISGFSQLL
ncbi:hypothetical protein GN244_ATG04208 [Phytophthora infestans]|uniref:Uncharacterized protein n=1 Tax=Phytophthora infestans TaxID=4787 RepID=A0A833THM4_PHYIN|nr:hypothetical protein GN244_ATG04208 [Phytophthora infestans]KAF4133825.1 hypothetical protein GN958_ATG17162 [Phytophthora infestans]KAF4143961.1 hypothetical protein GN958_ATG06848 [Phytophthora infestans]